MSMDPEHLNVLSKLVDESCQQVLSTLDSSFFRADCSEPKNFEYISLIDAASSDIELNLVLKCSQTALHHTHPQNKDKQALSEEHLKDWVAELANRFMGALKNTLIPYQHTLMLGVPTLGPDESFLDCLINDSERLIMSYHSDHGDVDIDLYIKLQNPNVDFSIKTAEMPQESCVEDGELELF